MRRVFSVNQSGSFQFEPSSGSCDVCFGFSDLPLVTLYRGRGSSNFVFS